MNLTDEAVALLIDPKREQRGWWWKVYHCPFCRTSNGVGEHTGGSWSCDACEKRYAAQDSTAHSFIYTGPPLTTDRVAAFTWVTPVLEACECVITTSAEGTIVDFVDGEVDYYGISGAHATDHKPYPAATTAALAWLNEHDPERLRKAVEGVNNA